MTILIATPLPRGLGVIGVAMSRKSNHAEGKNHEKKKGGLPLHLWLRSFDRIVAIIHFLEEYGLSFINLLGVLGRRAVL
jgi:hypothetical protein